jgi:hypothetical protein
MFGCFFEWIWSRNSKLKFWFHPEVTAETVLPNRLQPDARQVAEVQVQVDQQPQRRARRGVGRRGRRPPLEAVAPPEPKSRQPVQARTSAGPGFRFRRRRRPHWPGCVRPPSPQRCQPKVFPKVFVKYTAYLVTNRKGTKALYPCGTWPHDLLARRLLRWPLPKCKRFLP